MEWIASSSGLQPKHMDFLVNMLLWPEIKEEKDSSVRLCILQALKKFPTPSILDQLRLHLSFLYTRKQDASAGTHFYGDLHHEIDRVEELITRCKKATGGEESNERISSKNS
jgi:hypothetical protein